MDFDDAISWPENGPGRWIGTIPTEWGQGRSAFGGVTTAAATRAMSSLVDSSRALRSLSASLVGPIILGEPVLLEASVLRAGRSLTHTEARLTQGGQVKAVVLAAYGGPRPSAITVPLARRPDDLPEPSDCFRFPYLPGVTPEFTRQMEMRWTHGAIPFTGNDESVIGLWLRHLTPATGVDALVGLLDTPPSPVLQMMKVPAPASTVRWAAHIVGVPEIGPDDYCWLHSTARSAGDGYATMLASLYGPDGALLAWLEQLVVVFDG